MSKAKGATKGVEKPLGVVDELQEESVSKEESVSEMLKSDIEPQVEEPAVTPAEVVATEPVLETVPPPAPEPPSPPEMIIESAPFKIDMAKINKELLFRMFYALVMSQPQPYVGVPGSRRIGIILGATTTKAQAEAWAEVKAFINDLNKAKAQS